MQTKTNPKKTTFRKRHRNEAQKKLRQRERQSSNLKPHIINYEPEETEPRLWNLEYFDGADENNYIVRLGESRLMVRMEDDFVLLEQKFPNQTHLKIDEYPISLCQKNYNLFWAIFKTVKEMHIKTKNSSIEHRERMMIRAITSIEQQVEEMMKIGERK